jgi:hypothetical protein
MNLIRLEKPVIVNDEYNYIENVIAEITTIDPTGHDVMVGYVYINDDGKLRREFCGWL